MINLQLVYPLLAMLFLAFIVISITFLNRVNEMKENRIHPQSVSLRSESSVRYKNTKASDNLLNIFETPIIFYILSILFIVFKNHTTNTIIIMWIYTIARYAHSYIHCTYNKVMHRFYAFLISVIALFLLFINFVLNLGGIQ